MNVCHLVYLVDYVWLRETEEIVVALERLGVIFEFLAAEGVLLKLVHLNHGAHTPIKDHDALF